MKVPSLIRSVSLPSAALATSCSWFYCKLGGFQPRSLEQPYPESFEIRVQPSYPERT